eukprot:TRINITY_DN8203_c0_g1_i1.p1 TRINITY_DN8203_c0_g1~~TRINITY_DN8203_c0_g1_i1.p1  ORF type:complete len:145 (+),score=27.41 TRINITY_DN8203_c0_g1_i1:112-546(+)
MTTQQRVHAMLELPAVSESGMMDDSRSSQASSEDGSNSSARFMREHLQALRRGELQAVKAMFEEKDRQLAESITHLSKPSGATSAPELSVDAAFAGAIRQQQFRSANTGVISPAEVGIDLEIQTHSDMQPCAEKHHDRPSKSSL